MQIKMKPTSVIVARLGLEPNGDAHRFFTNTCALHMDKYVPFDTGALAETVVIDGTSINTGNVFENAIVYNQEYASYVYYGLSRNGKPLNYQTDKHELAGSYWDQRMWSAEKDVIAREVTNHIRRGNR